MIIKIVIIIFVLVVLWRTFWRFRRNDITLRELIIWSVFWLLVAVVALVPKATDVVARFVGVERGADLLVYLSIMVLFFAVFKIIVKLEKIDRDVTVVVRKMALDQLDNKNKKNQEL